MKKYFLLGLLLFLIPQTAHLQTNIEEQISIDLSPRYPGPNELVFVSIESFQIDLNKSKIDWSINNSLIESGFGLKNFSFTTGFLGEETSLKIRIEKKNGQIVEKIYSINPGEVDLYYEAETYTPPFYKGKPEYTYQSRLKLIALPNFVDSNGRQISSENVVYKWKINGEVDAANSGTGEDVYYYESGLISGPIQVVLEASPVNSNQIGRIIETISPVDPTILIYEKNPIYGTIFEQNIKNGFNVEREEIELLAIPYNFSSDIINTGDFEWRLNGSEIKNFFSNNIIFRKTDNKASSNNISIQIENPSKILQLQKYSFVLNFNNSNKEFNF